MTLGIVGCIGRFKPLHLGGQAMLEALCDQADRVIIGIGSSNKYNARNQFTADESQEMIERSLEDRANYSCIHVPDFAHLPEYADGKRWRQYVLDNYGPLDHFVSGNEYVARLLGEEYDIIHPVSLIAPENRTPLRATDVRIAMATFGDWKSLVPERVAEYLEEKCLVERFRKEFGLQTLAQLAGEYPADDPAAEMLHAQER